MHYRRNIELYTGIAQLFDCAPPEDEPFITCVDAEQEFVVLYNPRNEYFPLGHYSIADGKLHHTFKFPRRCKIPPRSEYCIYTCPGAPNFDHGSLMEYHVLWTNHDGSLRKMEVLNNGMSFQCFVADPIADGIVYMSLVRQMLCKAVKSSWRNHFTMRSWAGEPAGCRAQEAPAAVQYTVLPVL
jgi:hypothetical protein